MLSERYLTIIYNDQQSSFTELLNKGNSGSIYIRNIQRLTIEMFRFYNELLPPLMSNMFKLKAENSYNVRLRITNVYHGTESISYLGPKIWDILSEKLKNIDSLEHFRKEIKTWKSGKCLCRLCKVYIESVDFSNFYKTYDFFKEFLCFVFILSPPL